MPLHRKDEPVSKLMYNVSFMQEMDEGKEEKERQHEECLEVQYR